MVQDVGEDRERSSVEERLDISKPPVTSNIWDRGEEVVAIGNITTVLCMRVRKEELILSDLCYRTDIMDLSSYCL